MLILGGSGGVGTFAFQFAASRGAQVISTTSTSNVAFVQALGAEMVIDYTQMQGEDEVQSARVVMGEAALFSILCSVLPNNVFEHALAPCKGAKGETK